jgi:aryl-alcohol dehydrogenase-like predicted oxidoreductase
MRYRILGRHTGLRVSELVLGTGMFGTKWGHGADRDESRRVFDGYVEAGGNFLDTSDSYQFGESESLLGEVIRTSRDDLVVATKYTQSADPKGSPSVTGNSRKATVRSLEQSLIRLRTDRIDLYWVHMPDGVTPIDEIVRDLDDLVRSGKVLYVGLSNFPAWRTAAAAMRAELRGYAPIAAQQIEYSLVQRTPGRELLPMAAAFGLATDPNIPALALQRADAARFGQLAGPPTNRRTNRDCISDRPAAGC